MLHDNHWKTDDHVQRMTEEDWKQILLEYNDKITYKGRYVQLVAKPIGYGVVEVSKSQKDLK